MKNYINKILNIDCISGLKDIPDNSVDGCITDPPYNYEFIGHKWNINEIERRISKVQNSKTLVKNIPYGSGLSGGVRNELWYKKNADNITEYRKWIVKWGTELYRILKPGAFIMVFNSTRTIAHVQVSLEECRFYARDIIVWKKNSGIPKGINIAKKLEKENYQNFEQWDGWHSCLRNEWESIAVLQKPIENNYHNNIMKWGIGVFNAKHENGFKSNIIDKQFREPKEHFNIHCTVKPIGLIEELICLIIPEENNKIIIDPFMGSGTTALAAIKQGINYIGFETVAEYIQIANKRIKEIGTN